MIASLKGAVLHKGIGHCIVDVGGVGYKVHLSSRCLEKLPGPSQEVFLLIHTAVREDDISLFGFLEENEKALFEKLITVNGIGKKLALNILSGIQPRELLEAIHREDLLRLTAIPGVGKKTAERIVVDLKDKLIDLLATASSMVLSPKGTLYDEALSALVNLGYQRGLAERTLSRLTLQDGIPIETVVRQALKSMSTH